MKKFLGEKFGRLLVVGRQGDRATCVCDCGGTADVRMDKLRSGNTKSCGCLLAEHMDSMQALKEAAALRRQEVRARKAAERAKVVSERREKAADSARLKAVWSAMWGRCTSPANPSWERYGGRGITVCPTWRDFSTFEAWAKASGYTRGLWLERRDNDRGYSEANCTWATPTTQGRNRRNTLWVTDGETSRPLAEVASRLGIPYMRAYVLHRQCKEAGESPPHLRHFAAVATRAPT